LGISSTIQAAIPRTICQYVSTFSHSPYNLPNRKKKNSFLNKLAS
jgi:hypothetical protein